MLGLRSFIYEAGCGMVLDGEDQLLTEEVDDAGANTLLLSRYAGRLEMYDPWNLGRASSRLYLGQDIDAAEADQLLTEEGFGALRLVDNGVMHGAPSGHAYHLVPREASKAGAVARHMQARGLAPEEAIAVGDSLEDLGAAAVVGTFWLVANAEPEVHDAARGLANVRVAEGSNGAGVYEAVITELAERR
jgi:hydroxymethylpyrimidine pyrophosphatase-like HAD family hydrolase